MFCVFDLFSLCFIGGIIGLVLGLICTLVYMCYYLTWDCVVLIALVCFE